MREGGKGQLVSGTVNDFCVTCRKSKDDSTILIRRGEIIIRGSLRGGEK